MTASPAEPLSRRDRARAETVREIKQTARRVLVDQGVDGLALRAVAREMGMTAPGLYRYFDSREDLVEHVVADLYDELTDVLEAVRDAVAPGDAGCPADGRGRAPSGPGRSRTTPSSGCCSAARARASSRRTDAHELRRAPGPARRRSGSAASSPPSSRGSTWSAASRCRPTTSSTRAAGAAAAPGARSFPVAAAARRHAGLPVLLDPALRDGLHGDLRAPPVRAGRRGADVRGGAAQPGRGARGGRRVPAASPDRSREPPRATARVALHGVVA